jgi:hypothetical protein
VITWFLDADTPDKKTAVVVALDGMRKPGSKSESSAWLNLQEVLTKNFGTSTAQRDHDAGVEEDVVADPIRVALTSLGQNVENAIPHAKQTQRARLIEAPSKADALAWMQAGTVGGQFCRQYDKSSQVYHCKYATLKDCKREPESPGRSCVTRPATAYCFALLDTGDGKSKIRCYPSRRKCDEYRWFKLTTTPASESCTPV